MRSPWDVRRRDQHYEKNYDKRGVIGMCATRIRAAVLTVRPAAGRACAMRREYVEMTWGEIMAALATIGIITFLLLV
jgi:hypothetical protein